MNANSLEASDRAKLMKAALSHQIRTGHKGTFVGNNFVECPVCKRHAVLSNGTLYLRADKAMEVISPDEF